MLLQAVNFTGYHLIRRTLSVMNVLVAVDVQVVSSNNVNKQENHSRDRCADCSNTQMQLGCRKKSYFKGIETFDNKSQKTITCISEIDLHQYSLMVLLLCFGHGVKYKCRNLRQRYCTLKMQEIIGNWPLRN